VTKGHKFSVDKYPNFGMRNKHLSREHRYKLSFSHKGKGALIHKARCPCCVCKRIRHDPSYVSELTRQKLSLSKLGNKNPAKRLEVRKKISKSKIGKTFPVSEYPNYGNRGKPTWIKGLTKENDERVEKMAENLKGQKRSKETCKKISLSRLGKPSPKPEGFMEGDKNPNWRGGIGRDGYLNEFGAMAKVVRRRDSHVCQLCGKIEDGRALDVHHIDYNKKNNFLLNLVALCHPCNVRVSYNREHWTSYWQNFISERFGGM